MTTIPPAMNKERAPMQSDAMDVKDMPLSLLIKEEREAHAKLLCLAIQEERLLQLFYEKLEEIDVSRRSLTHRLQNIDTAMADYRKLAVLMQLPPELQRWQVLCGPLVASWSADAQEELITCGDDQALEHHLRDVFSDVADTSKPLTSQERQRLEDRMLATSTPRLERVKQLPDAVTCNAFIPYLSKPKAESAATSSSLLRRPVGSDLAVMKTATMGRVLLSLRDVDVGRCVFAEVPSLIVPTAEMAVSLNELLPPMLAAAHNKIMAQDAVFQKRRNWDRRLVSAFMMYVEARWRHHTQVLDRPDQHLCALVGELGNPLKLMEPERVEDLAEFADFILAALPAAVTDVMMGRDECVRFLSVFMVNAVGVAGGTAVGLDTTERVQEVEATAAGSCSTNTAIATSTFANGVACRCLLGMVSMMEHSCEPNCAIVCHRTNSMHDASPIVIEVRAIRPITAGERLSISYVTPMLSRVERLEVLWTRYWFRCSCTECVHGEDTSREALLVTETSPSGLVTSTHRLFPLGDGKTWRKVPTNSNNNEEQEEEATTLPFADALVSAFVLFERSVFAQEDVHHIWHNTSLREAGVAGRAGLMLSPRHHLRVASFLRWCMDRSLLPSAIKTTEVVAFVKDVADVTFARSGCESPCQLSSLLSDLDPIESFMAPIRGAATSSSELRARILGQNVGTEMSQGYHDASRRAHQYVMLPQGSSKRGLHTCLAVWEAAFAVMLRDSATSTSSVSTALAFGIWLMLAYGIGVKGGDRCMHWQAVLLSRCH